MGHAGERVLSRRGRIRVIPASLWGSSGPDYSPRLGKLRQWNRVFRRQFFWRFANSPLQPHQDVTRSWIPLGLAPLPLHGPGRPRSHSAQPAHEVQTEVRPAVLLLCRRRGRRGPRTDMRSLVTHPASPRGVIRIAAGRGAAVFSFLFAICHL